jgi:predicted class III extradiol MEMO1 family dioxygenase
VWSVRESIYDGDLPERSEEVARFFDALGNIGAREGGRLFWILGIDMAHMGRRYGDQLRASARLAEMQAVEERDRKRIEHINDSDIRAFWSLVQHNHDDLKWCGSSPLYTFMKVNPGLSGSLLNYDQWQIDPHSVVSFAAMRFDRPS